MQHIYFDTDDNKVKCTEPVKNIFLTGKLDIKSTYEKSDFCITIITNDNKRFDFLGESIQDAIDKANEHFKTIK